MWLERRDGVGDVMAESRGGKVKAKSNNIAGLQIADLIAHPAFRAALARRESRSPPENFGSEFSNISAQPRLSRSRFETPGTALDTRRISLS